MPQPLQVSTDRIRVVRGLRTMLAALDSSPVRKSQLSSAWDGFRDAFGEGPSPEGVTVDANGRPDWFGLPALIRMSMGITSEARDALQDVVNAITRGSVFVTAWVFDDSHNAEPTPAEIREHLREAQKADEGPIRDAKKAIRLALSLLEQTSSKQIESDPQHDRFVFSEMQELIFNALDKKALTLDTLAEKLKIDRSNVHRNGLKELMKHGYVKNERRIGGYFRPDAPPPQLANRQKRPS